MVLYPSIDDDDDDDDEAPIACKRVRSGLTLTGPSTTAPTRRLAIVYDSDDMEGVDEEHSQSGGEEESGEEGSDDGDAVEVTGDHEDEASGEVDDRNRGLTIGGGDMVNNDVNPAGSLGTKSPMLGTFADPDVLDCPICCEALTIPVFQCENGHIECSFCCIKTGNKCPSCSLPIGYIRCRSIERILSSVKFSCQNLEYGCKETMLHSKRVAHEKGCIFAPCYCPVQSCDFVGSPKNLYAHVRGRHLSCSAQFDYKLPLRFRLESKHKCVILLEKTDCTIFIINVSNNRVPLAINLIRIGPLHSEEEFCYELSVEYQGSTLKLKSVPATMPKWSASHPLRKYLPIPSDFVDSSGYKIVAVCIEKRPGA